MALKSIKEVLSTKKELKRHITREFQDYGYRLAESLDDLPHKSLYIKLAKEEDRVILQKAWEFVIDSNAKSKARLFMWKVKQLRDLKIEIPKSDLTESVGSDLSKSSAQRLNCL